MTTLHLGVVDIAYARALSTQQRRTLRWRTGKKPWEGFSSTITTGTVAEILESRYSLFSMFFLLRGADIAKALEQTMQNKLENLLMGGPVSDRLFNDSDLSGVEQAFREFLDNGEMDGRAPGVPTKAAQRGVNHRLQRPNAKGNPPRQSFIDTGLLQNSFKAWVS